MAYFIVGGFIIAIPTLEVWKKLQGNNQCIFRSSHLRNYHPYRSAINMNMSKHLRKSFQTTTSFVISYAYAYLWTFLEMPKFNERCLQRTDAALQVSVGLSKRFCKNEIAEPMRSEVGVYLQRRLERRSLTSKLC